MTMVEALLLAYVSVCLLYWLWTAVAVVRLIRSVPLLAHLDPPAPAAWPRLSVVIPACNEAAALPAAARSLLAEGYPDLQLVLVADRSTDATGEAIDRLAEADARVRAVHVTELPDGWLGKVHALARGLDEADGELVLLTDADVHFRPGALRSAVAWCLHRRLDHLVALPQLWPSGLLLDASLSVFLRQFLVFCARPWAAIDPNDRAFIGIGAFNLFRRSTLAASEGLEWLRMEVADDMGLGLLLKRAGARCDVVGAFDRVGLHWYRTLAGAARGTEKAYATVSRLSLLRTVRIVATVLALEMSPLLCLLPLLFGSVRWLGWLGVAAAALAAASSAVLARWARGPVLPAVLGPLAVPLLMAMFLRAGVLGRRRGGVMWRGTLYPSEQLRQGMRVRLPL